MRDPNDDQDEVLKELQRRAAKTATKTSAPPKPEQAETETRSSAPPLPEIICAADMVAAERVKERPPQLIEGLLHQGEKLLLAGASKSYKSWTLMDLALSVSTGEPFWEMDTQKGRVLILNYEIQPFFFAGRLEKIAKAKGVGMPTTLDIWNLRGHRADFSRVLLDLRERMEYGAYSLVVIDPIYSALQGRNESDAGEIAALMNELERLAECGPAVAIGHHFAKGNSALKDSIDRASGSGVFARDPDAIVTLGRHQQDGAFVAEFTLRNFAPLDPVGLRLKFPLLTPDGTVDVELLKGAQVRKRAVKPEELVQLLPLNGTMTTAELVKQAEIELSIKRTKTLDLLKQAKDLGLIRKNASGENERAI